MVFKVIGSKLELVRSEPILVTNTKNYYIVEFRFDKSWSSMINKTAVFYQPNVAPYCEILDSENKCYLPELSNDDYLYVGVFGFDIDGNTRIPTNYECVYINEGAYKAGISPPDPSDDLYEKIYSTAYNAEQIAQSVRDDANAGKFNGLTPYIGSNGNWFIGNEDTGVRAAGNASRVQQVLFTKNQFTQVDSKYLMTITLSQHSLGYNASISNVERAVDSGYSDIWYSYNKSTDGSLSIIVDEPFDGRAILTEILST